MKYVTVVQSNLRVLGVETWDSIKTAMGFLESMAKYDWVDLFYLRGESGTLLYHDKRGGKMSPVTQGENIP